MKKLNTIKHSIAILLIFLSSSVIYGQKTGSFDTTITFSNSTRLLSAYVPTNYNPANKYKLMVCLHGLGDNSANYRNALANSLNWKTQFPNTIFICPESSTTTTDYFEPEGSNNEEIIRESINFASATYSIDTAEIVLQGFSLGGRAALRFGLDNPTLFKGLLLNTPAIQGVKEGSNKQTRYQFNMAAAKQIPIYISHGDQDVLYTAPIDSIIERLIVNDCPLFFTRIAGMGHTIPQQAQLGDFTKFFDSTTTDTFGIEVVRVYLPNRTCDGHVSGRVLVRNTGKTTIDSIMLKLTTPGVSPKYLPVSGLNLAPFQHSYLSIPNHSIGPNEVFDFIAKATSINNNINTDPFCPNGENEKSKTLVNQSTGRALPFGEGFEGNDFPPLGWVLNPSGDVYSSWDVDTDTKKTGAASMVAFNTILIFDNSLRVEELQTPLLDLTSLPNPHLTFDYAYNYHKFKANNDSVVFADTLEVLVSTDCGQTFTSLYRGGGDELSTFSTPTLNPNTLEKCFAIPAQENWKKAYLPLNNFATSANAIISVRYQSGLGGSINIDNISVGNNPLSVEKPAEKTIAIYPNPAQNNAYVSVENAESIETVTVFDISGKRIALDMQNITPTTVILNTETLANGIYYLQIEGKGFIQNQKLVIKK